MHNVRVNRGLANVQLFARVALVAACGATGYACAVNDVGAEDAGEALELAGDVAPAATVIGPLPTATVTVGPAPTFPPMIAYDALINLDPGQNSKSAVDDDTKSPFRVRVNDAIGLTNGLVNVYVPGASGQLNPAICAAYSVDFTVEGYLEASNEWVQLGQKTATGAVHTSGGEFPTTSCHVGASLAVGSTYAKLQVRATGKRNAVFNGTPLVLTQNTTVSVSGKTPIPDPGRELHVTSVTLDAAKTGARATIQNEGPLTATGVRATIHGSYAYCPPASGPNQSNYCSIVGHPCEGFFCPNTVNPSGNPVFPHRAPKICTIDSKLHSSSFTLGDDASGTYAWPSVLTSDDQGCAPCNPNDGRCANISLTVSSDSTSETDPWDTWDRDSRSAFFSGVNNLGPAGAPAPTACRTRPRGASPRGRAPRGPSFERAPRPPFERAPRLPFERALRPPFEQAPAPV